jgi:hypothetical protein
MKNDEEHSLLHALKRIELTLNEIQKTLRALADSQGDVIDSLYGIEASAPDGNSNEEDRH